jgi:hypothetical protein
MAAAKVIPAWNNELTKLALKLKFIYSMTGLFLGLACILSGVVLGLNGVFGKTSWTASLLGLSTSLTDATPGVIVFVVGIFMVLITRFRFKISDGFDEHGPYQNVILERKADFRPDVA